MEAEIWDTLHRHLKSVLERDAETYTVTTALSKFIKHVNSGRNG